MEILLMFAVLVLVGWPLMHKYSVLKKNNKQHTEYDKTRDGWIVDFKKENEELTWKYAGLIRKNYQLKVLNGPMYVRLKREIFENRKPIMYDAVEEGGGHISWTREAQVRFDLIIYLFENGYCVKRRKK